MKTTVVNGVLTSYELMLANYLGGVLYRAVTILCGSDTVTDPVMGQIITPLPHNITQLLTSPYLYCNHSICCHCHCLHFCCRCCCHYVVPFVVLLLFPPLEMQSTLSVYAHIVVSIENEGHKSSSALAVTIIALEVAECTIDFLGWQMAR